MKLIFTKGNLLKVVVLFLLSSFGRCDDNDEKGLCNGTSFYLFLQNGSNGYNTFWFLRNVDEPGNFWNPIASGGPYDYNDPDPEAVEVELCLEQACYEFEIENTCGGCQNSRIDNYFINLDGEQIHYSDGVFGYGEKISFCAGGCDDYKFSLSLGMDYYPQQTSWKLRKGATTGSQIRYPEVISGDNYRSSYYDYYQSSANIYVEQCIDPGCYVFQMFDEDGDGICCGTGNPDTVGYTISIDEEQVHFGNGDYGSGENISFCVGSSGCIDSPLIIADLGKDCADVINNPSICEVNGVQSHCPSACGACADYACGDSSLLVEFDGGEFTCAILESSDEIRIDRACSRKDILATCRETCSNCIMV